jgi:hypothetical protein
MRILMLPCKGTVLYRLPYIKDILRCIVFCTGLYGLLPSIGVFKILRLEVVLFDEIVKGFY